jgi:hypothetical protein
LSSLGENGFFSILLGRKDFSLSMALGVAPAERSSSRLVIWAVAVDA